MNEQSPGFLIGLFSALIGIIFNINGVGLFGGFVVGVVVCLITHNIYFKSKDGCD